MNRYANTANGGLTGFSVEAVDGSIGKVDEATREDLVVRTGFWVFGSKRVLPAGAIASVDTDGQRVYVSRTKDEVKHAPSWKTYSGTTWN
jgi:hypothetical protein